MLDRLQAEMQCALEGQTQTTSRAGGTASKYFSIISVDDYDVTIMSRNTGHIWYLHNPEYPGEGTVIIFHKHKASHPYHQHGRAKSLRQAVRSIKDMTDGRWVGKIRKANLSIEISLFPMQHLFQILP